jgi:K+-sensing histidine kinase KdpD
MNRPRLVSGLALAAAVVAPLVVSATMALWRDSLNPGTVSVVLAGVVVAVASTGRRAAAVVAAVSATVWFDYFHTVPYNSFTIHERDEAITAAALLFVGLLAAEVQTRSLRRRELVEEGSNEISRIGAVTDLVASGTSVEDLLAIVNIELTDLLFLRSCRFEAEAGDGRSPAIERTGEVSYGSLRWRADKLGLPGDEVDLPIYALGRFGGRFVLTPTPGVPITFDRRIVAVALADQVGAAFAMNLIV